MKRFTKGNRILGIGALSLLGRICVSLLFFWAAFAKIADLPGTEAYMQSKEMPLIPLFLPLAIVMQMLGAVAILIGYRARIGAGILIAFILPAAVIFHDFWNLEGTERLIEQIMFMKDVGILGGLLFILGFGAGPISLDRLRYDKRGPSTTL